MDASGFSRVWFSGEAVKHTQGEVAEDFDGRLLTRDGPGMLDAEEIPMRRLLGPLVLISPRLLLPFLLASPLDARAGPVQAPDPALGTAVVVPAEDTVATEGVRAPTPPSHDPARTAVELGSTFGVLATLYFIDGRSRQLDRSVGDGLGMLLSPARLRFDDNSFYINNVLHPLEGLVFYGIPRANGAGAKRSFLTMAAASVLWEQVVELQEVASINDHVVTPIAGFALGEALFQTREWVRGASSDPPTFQDLALDALFGLPVNSSELIASRRSAPKPGGDNGEIPVRSRADAADLRLHVGLQGGWGAGSTGAGLELGVTSEILQPSGAVVSTRLDADAVVTGSGVAQVRVFARVVPVALGTRGSSRPIHVTLGPSVAFDGQMRGGWEGNSGLSERVFAASLLGATANAHLGGTDATATRIVLDVFANFTSASAIAWPDGRSLRGEASVFSARGYYYGYGLSTRAAAALDLGPLEIEAEVKRHRVRSIEARDRHPELAANPAPKRDRWSSASASVGWRPASGLRWSTGVEHQSWHGRVDDLARRFHATSWFVRTAWTP